MKTLSTLLLSALFVLECHAQSGYLEEMQQKWSNATEYTLEVARLMPAEGYDFKPTVEQISFAEQIIHLSNNINWLATDYLGAEKSESPPNKMATTKDELLGILEDALNRGALALRRTEDSRLDEKSDFFAGPMSKRQIITLMNDHLTHHRAQAIVYLRLRGISPPRYRGW